MSSKKKVLLGCLSMALAMIGDYLMGINSIGMISDSEVPYGIIWNLIPDWRYTLSGILGFFCVPLFAAAATELLKVLERDYDVKNSAFFRLFRIANWSGIFYFAFIHICICMLGVIYNAGMSATGDQKASVEMVIRTAKSIALPIGLGFLFCDIFVMIGWIGMIFKGILPLPKIAAICNPVIIALFGQLLTFIQLPFEGIDSGFESFGWLLLYAVCAYKLIKKS